MTSAEARFNNSLRPQKPEGSLGRTAQDGHLTLTQLLNYDHAESDVEGFEVNRLLRQTKNDCMTTVR